MKVKLRKGMALFVLLTMISICTVFAMPGSYAYAANAETTIELAANEDGTEEVPEAVEGRVVASEKGYTITVIEEIEDSETPLANLADTCCVLHFIVVLAACAIYAVYAKTMKSYQERIIEMESMLHRLKM